MTTTIDRDGFERITRSVNLPAPPPPKPSPPKPRPRKHPKLKPCPFCGSPAKIVRSSGTFGYTYPTITIRCSDDACGRASTKTRPTEEWKQGEGTYSIFKEAFQNVIAQWEERADPSDRRNPHVY